MDEQNPLNQSPNQPLSTDPLQTPPSGMSQQTTPVSSEPEITTPPTPTFNTPLPTSTWETPAVTSATPEPVAPVTQVAPDMPEAPTLPEAPAITPSPAPETPVMPPTPPVTQPEAQWPEQKPKSNAPKVLMGVLALFLVAGAAVGAYFVSTRVSQQQAVAPTAPESEPMAAACGDAGTSDKCGAAGGCPSNYTCTRIGGPDDFECRSGCNTTCVYNSSSNCYGKTVGSVCTDSYGASGKCEIEGTTPNCMCKLGSGTPPPGNGGSGATCGSKSASKCEGKKDGDDCGATGTCVADSNGDCECQSSGGGGGRPTCPAGSVSNGLCEKGLRPITVENCCEEVGACKTNPVTGKIKFAKTGKVSIYSLSKVQFRADIKLTGPKTVNLDNVLIDDKVATVSKTFDVVAGQQYDYSFQVIYPGAAGKKDAYGWNPPPVAGKCGPKNNPGTGAGKCGARLDIVSLLDYAKAKASITGITAGTTAANIQCWSDPIETPPDPISDYDYNDFVLVFGYEGSPTVTGGACMDIKIYKMKTDGTYMATPLTQAQLNNLKEGDKLRLTVTANKADLKARFRVSIGGTIEAPSWRDKVGYTDNEHKIPYYDYEITKTGSYSFRGQVSTK